ncbi:MAG: hypothetical protein M3Z75_15410 [Actinomycetota bacterium]|nr:hypothetical protein [Actinomycetota bacterium]
MTGHRAGVSPEPTTAASPLAVVHPAPLLGRPCVRCGAVGTHYLTCPGLQLPAGYRLSEDPAPAYRRDVTRPDLH